MVRSVIGLLLGDGLLAPGGLHGSLVVAAVALALSGGLPLGLLVGSRRGADRPEGGRHTEAQVRIHSPVGRRAA